MCYHRIHASPRRFGGPGSSRERAHSSCRRPARACPSALQPGTVRGGDQRRRAGAPDAVARRRRRSRRRARIPRAFPRQRRGRRSRQRARSPAPDRSAAFRVHRARRIRGRSGRGALFRGCLRRRRRRARSDRAESAIFWRAMRASASSTGGRARSIATRSRAPKSIARVSISASAHGWTTSCPRVPSAGPPRTGSPPLPARKATCRRRGMQRSPAWVRAPLTSDRGVILRADHRSSRAARDCPRSSEGHGAAAGNPASAVGSVQGAMDRIEIGELASC